VSSEVMGLGVGLPNLSVEEGWSGSTFDISSSESRSSSGRQQCEAFGYSGSIIAGFFLFPSCVHRLVPGSQSRIRRLVGFCVLELGGRGSVRFMALAPDWPGPSTTFFYLLRCSGG